MRKQIAYIFAAMLPVVCSCGEAGLQGNEDEHLDKESYYIYVDKTSIESDGKDAALFTIKSGAGEVLSTYENMGSVYYKNTATGVRLPRYSESFTSIEDGQYEFVGIYKGKETVNTVTITSDNRDAYEVFHRNVAVFKLTATHCPNCPSMTTALNGLDEDAKSHSVVIACHNEDAFSVSCGKSDLAGAVALKADPELPSLGLPSLVFDLSFLKIDRSSSAISGEIMNRRVEAPAEVGIKITSFSLVGNDLKVTASVKADKGGDYDMSAAVLADGLYYENGYSADGYYNDVAISINSIDFVRYSNATGFTLGAGEEYEREFTFSFNDGAPSPEALAKLKTVVLVHKKYEDGASDVNNVASCAYGSSVDYLYN